MGQRPVAIEGATAYLDAVRWGILPFLGFAALRSFVEGLSRPLPVTIIAFVGVAVNIGANELLMFGRWGLPALGLAGTGWASTIVFSFLLGTLAALVHRAEPFSGHGVLTRLRESDLSPLRELVWVGAPMGASRGIESSLFAVTTVLMGMLGTTALAAHQIALQCAAFAFMVPLGIGMAGTVRVGQAAVLLLLRFHRQVGRAVEEAVVPTSSNGAPPASPSADVPPVPAAEETSSG